MMPYIGPDTVDIVKRTKTGGLDEWVNPDVTETVVTKTNCAVTVGDGTSTGIWQEGASAGVAAADAPPSSVAIYVMKAALPVDDDTKALNGDDAVVFDGIVYELNRDATIKYTFRGRPDHVRVFGTAQYFTDRGTEQVLVTPHTNRDDTGQPSADGPTRTLFSYNVEPGNTTRHYGITGDEDEADFTVGMPIDDPIKDNDLMFVRGRWGIARVQVDLARWNSRMVKICLVRCFNGGRR